MIHFTMEDVKELGRKTELSFAFEVKTQFDHTKRNSPYTILDFSIIEDDDWVTVYLITEANVLQGLYDKKEKRGNIGAVNRNAFEHAKQFWEDNSTSIVN